MIDRVGLKHNKHRTRLASLRLMNGANESRFFSRF